MGDPAYVMLNGHRLKVQRWSRSDGAVSFTTVIHGEHLGNEIVTACESGAVVMALDSGEQIVGTAHLTDRRASGSGPKAVQRLEITIQTEADGAPERSVDEKLDAILAEVRALRAEVAALRGGASRSVVPTGASTLMDFEISTEGE